MSLADSESSVEGLSPSQSASSEPNAAKVSQVWLDGDVLSCACPECGAPMTIRLWLRLAECRLCGTQVELTEEQERAAHELIERRGSPLRPPPLPQPRTWSKQVHSPPRLKAIPVELPPPAPSPHPPLRALPIEQPRLTAVPVVEPVPPPVLQAIPVEESAKPRLRARRRRWISRHLAEMLVSCLVSLCVHMLIILALGLWVFQKPKAATMILMAQFELQSAGVQRTNPIVEGAKSEPPSPSLSATRDEPQKIKLPELSRLEMKSLTDQLVRDPSADPPSAVVGPVRAGAMFAGRDPAIRKQIVRREGGDDQTERAVALGLKWLAKHQFADGRWSLHLFEDAGDCGRRCSLGGTISDTAGTALGVLPFLGAGYTQRHGEYRDVVERALNWLIADQQADGSFRSSANGTMYAHGQATIALCEAYALTRDRRLLEPAQRAVDYIVQAQHSAGGWRYQPHQRGDLSVTGWEVMALRSAKTAYLRVPPEVLRRTDEFLDTTQSSPGKATFGYTAGDHPTPAMTAEGLLCRQYGGWKADHPPLLAGADFLLTKFPPEPKNVNMYYWYYATQVMHHLGGERWRQWNDRIKPILIGLQEEEGHKAGSWAPGKHHDPVGGRLYMTALAVCTLEVYYRHMPLYRTAP